MNVKIKENVEYQTAVKKMFEPPTEIYGPSESQKYEISVFSGDILLPVYDKDKIIVQIPWRGNLSRFDGNTDGLGLVQFEEDLILTELLDGEATAKIIPPEEAVKLIVFFEQSHLLDKFNLREVLDRMVR